MSEKARGYLTLRAKLLSRGLTLRQWAQLNGNAISTTYDAVRGTRKGKVSARIYKQLEEFIHA